MSEADVSRIVHRRAPAKLNLALAVGRALPGGHEFAGYHPIASWMTPVDLADELLLTRLDEGSLSRYAIIWHPDAPRTSPIDWSITKDLAVRAHLALQETVGRELPVQLKLEKRIPVGGGLGGGSSNAASMLLGLRELFRLDVDDAALDKIAIGLGSDVPFFLREAACVIENLGERVEPVEPVDGWAVLVMPGFGCATGAVYGAFDESPPEMFRAQEVRAMASSGDAHGAALFNDLAPPALRVEPRLEELLIALNSQSGTEFRVTGSGSTLFALVADEGSCRAIAESAQRVSDSLAVRVARLGCP